MSQPDNAADVAFSFEVLSRSHARLRVERAAGTFGLRMAADGYTGLLGYYDAPLYAIELPDTPVDDRLTVRALLGSLRTESDNTEKMDVCRSINSWMAGSAAAGCENLLCSLPVGDYWLARSRKPLSYEDKIVMGNEIVPSPKGVLTLKVAPPFYSYVFGPNQETPAPLSGPLIGVPILNYLGGATKQGVIFFSFAENRVSSDVAELLYVVPTSGEMVLNTKVGWPPTHLNEDRKRWRETQAPEFIRGLIDH